MCASECVCFHAATKAKKSNHCECSSNGARLNGWWGLAEGEAHGLRREELERGRAKYADADWQKNAEIEEALQWMLA